jgi:hypothetical protein
MRLYLQIKDGAPFEHPITEANLKLAFPEIDLNNLPIEFAKFQRVDPVVNKYEVYVGLEYVKTETGYRDNHLTRPMTDEEKAIVDSAAATVVDTVATRNVTNGGA